MKLKVKTNYVESVEQFTASLTWMHGDADHYDHEIRNFDTFEDLERFAEICQKLIYKRFTYDPYFAHIMNNKEAVGKFLGIKDLDLTMYDEEKYGWLNYIEEKGAWPRDIMAYDMYWAELYSVSYFSRQKSKTEDGLEITEWI